MQGLKKFKPRKLHHIKQMATCREITLFLISRAYNCRKMYMKKNKKKTKTKRQRKNTHTHTHIFLFCPMASMHSHIINLCMREHLPH